LEDAEPDLALTFNRHRNVILAAHSIDGTVFHEYNFPSRDDGFTPAELEEHLRYIYEREGRAFKIQIAFGTLLQNTENMEFRYFHPHSNVDIFERPNQVSNPRDLQQLIEKVRALDIYEEVNVNHPDTKFKLVTVTNVRYKVFLMGFPLTLGCPQVKLPEHILHNKAISTMLWTDRSHAKQYSDNLCFFRCLAKFRGEKELAENYAVIGCYIKTCRGNSKESGRKIFQS